MTVSVKGAELFYSTRGKGSACLVLSAIGTKPYERLTPSQLSDRLRLVYVDLRGGGRSTGEPTDLTFDVLADDLEAIRVDLGVERIAVLGALDPRRTRDRVRQTLPRKCLSRDRGGYTAQRRYGPAVGESRPLFRGGCVGGSKAAPARQFGQAAFGRVLAHSYRS